jgi:hypothetical protein
MSGLQGSKTIESIPSGAVSRTHAEFPPDPYTVVQKEQGSEDVRIYWKSPKRPRTLKNMRSPAAPPLHSASNTLASLFTRLAFK